MVKDGAPAKCHTAKLVQSAPALCLVEVQVHMATVLCGWPAIDVRESLRSSHIFRFVFVLDA